MNQLDDAAPAAVPDVPAPATPVDDRPTLAPDPVLRIPRHELRDEAHRFTRGALDNPVAGADAAQRALAPIGLLILGALTDLIDLDAEDLERRRRSDRRLDKLANVLESALERLVNPPPPPDLIDSIARGIDRVLTSDDLDTIPDSSEELRAQLLTEIRAKRPVLTALYPKPEAWSVTVPPEVRLGSMAFDFRVEGRDRLAIERAVILCLDTRDRDLSISSWVEAIVHELEQSANAEASAGGSHGTVSS